MVAKKRKVEDPVTFPRAENPGGLLMVSARRFRSAWTRLVVRHRTTLNPDDGHCLPLLASKDTRAKTVEAGHGAGFDVLCREIVGACHWDMMQADNAFFTANAHSVQKVRQTKPGAKRPNEHVRLLPPAEA